MESMCAQTLSRFMLSSKRVLGNGVRTHVNTKEKKCPPLQEAQRSFETVTLHGSSYSCTIVTTAAATAAVIIIIIIIIITIVI